MKINKEERKKLFLITSSYFCAGGVIDKDRVIIAAPIIKYMHNWTTARIRIYCASKKWSVNIWNER